LVIPDVTPEQICELHLENLGHFGWDPVRRRLEILDQRQISHRTVPERQGVYGADEELNARLILPRGASMEIAREAAATVGRDSFQDAARMWRPDPAQPGNTLTIPAHFRDRLNVPFEESNDGRRLVFIDYNSEGQAFFDKVRSALADAGVPATQLRAVRQELNRVEAPDYGSILLGRNQDLGRSRGTSP
jgi:hypothetical protein